MQNILSIAALALFATAVARPTETVSTDNVFLLDNQCGYILDDYTPPEVVFAPNDTIWFYVSDLVSNCEKPDGTSVPCRADMFFTGEFGSDMFYQPYSVTYDFTNFGADEQAEWVYTLRYTFKNGPTSIVGTFPCDGVEYESNVNECMFDEELYKTEFYKHYRFKFFSTCSYNPELDTADFTLLQQSETCVDDAGNINVNKFTLASFTEWTPLAVVQDEYDGDFCPDCTPETTTTIEPTPTPTESPCETETETETVVPIPPSKCKSCESVTVNVNIY